MRSQILHFSALIPATLKKIPAVPALHLAFLACIIAFGIAIYSDTIDSPFIFDDESYIVNNPILRDPSFFSSPDKVYSLSNRMWTIKKQFNNRIAGHFSLWLNYTIHGLDVTGYHITNVFIHLMNSILIYILIIYILKTPFIRNNSSIDPSSAEIMAFLCALLFVAHPIQTQAVTYLSQRFTCLATLFYLLTFVLYTKARLVEYGLRSHMLYIFSLISAVIAMKTKEISFTLPIVLSLYEFMFLKDPIKKKIIYLTPFLLTMLIIPMTLLFSSISVPSMDNILKVSMETRDVSRVDYLFTQFSVIVTYISLFFLPLYQNIDYYYPIYNSFFLPQVFIPFIFLISIFLFALYLFSRSGKPSPHAWIYRIVSFGILYFFITISVESSVIPIKDVINEHRTYLPSFGVFLVFVSGIMLLKYRLHKPYDRVTIPITLAITIIFGIVAYERNSVWSSPISLWKDSVSKSYFKSRPHLNLGVSYLNAGELSAAIREFNVSLSMQPDFADAHNNLGWCYLKAGLIDKAEFHFRKSSILNPSLFEPHANLGFIYTKQGNYKNAEIAFLRALNLAPDKTNLYLDIGRIYESKGDSIKAIYEYRKATMISPNRVEPYDRLGQLYRNLGRLDDSIEAFQSSIRLKPEIASTHYNLGLSYKRQNRLANAASEFETALRLDRDYTDARKELDAIRQLDSMLH
jgi:tetratricopeptide (TPR) repeat protein